MAAEVAVERSRVSGAASALAEFKQTARDEASHMQVPLYTGMELYSRQPHI